MEDQLEVFVQGPGIARPALVTVPTDGQVGDIIQAAKGKGLMLDDEQSVKVWLEDADEPLDAHATLAVAGVKTRSRVQVHTCQRIHVTVNFNNDNKQHPFSPSATIAAVKAWAVQKFGLDQTAATEYVLQICGSTDKPAPDIEVGSLAQPGQCSACFDLVPQQLVQG
jgi:hypothetical protein